jgi:hypothetical protein
VFHSNSLKFVRKSAAASVLFYWGILFHTQDPKKLQLQAQPVFLDCGSMNLKAKLSERLINERESERRRERRSYH